MVKTKNKYKKVNDDENNDNPNLSYSSNNIDKGTDNSPLISDEEKKIINEMENKLNAFNEKNNFTNINLIPSNLETILEKEINDIQRTNRDINYDSFKSMASSLKSKNITKMDKQEIDKLIEEKKCLNTAIILMNKKINNLKKELAKYIYKGELYMNEFGKLIERQKIENDFNS